MLRKAGWILAFAVASLDSAWAQSNCAEPMAPAPVDGRSASQAQIIAALAAVKDFQVKSDAYQECMMTGMNAQKADAINNGTIFDTSIQQSVMAKVAASQQAKQHAVGDINAAVMAFKQKSPN